MKIKLKLPWFAPTVSDQINILYKRGGQRFRPGVHEVSDALYDALPSDTVILVPPNGKPAVHEERGVTKKQFEEKSMEARELDHIQAAHDEAEKNRKEARKAILAKAREAKAAKRAEREAEQLAAENPVEAEMKES
jgi:hypothetical protein